MNRGGTRRAIAALCLASACGWAHAQGASPAPAAPPGTTGSLLPRPPGTVTPPGSTATPTPTPGANARFVESCHQAMERGEVPAGCQGSLYPGEIASLRNEALRSNNPALLTLLGDAYMNNRSAISDIGQAYRWYLLAAVRGDPRAMARLSELYRNGRGAAQDRVRALGYARLAQRLAVPGSRAANEAAQASASLGSTMASEEIALADRFADDLENSLRREGAPLVGGPGATAPDPGRAGGVTLLERAPGPAPGPAIPGMSSLSQPAEPAPQAQPSQPTQPVAR